MSCFDTVGPMAAVPTGSFDSLARGSNHHRGLTGGAIECWGSNASGQASPPRAGPV